MDLREWVDEAARRRMPSLGHDDAYFLGSGIVGASGTPAGEWTFAIGPDYTCPNYLHSESVWLNDSGAILLKCIACEAAELFLGWRWCVNCAAQSQMFVRRIPAQSCAWLPWRMKAIGNALACCELELCRMVKQ